MICFTVGFGGPTGASPSGSGAEGPALLEEDAPPLFPFPSSVELLKIMKSSSAGGFTFFFPLVEAGAAAAGAGAVLFSLPFLAIFDSAWSRLRLLASSPEYHFLSGMRL